MKKHTITEGTRIDTLAGYYIFTGHNDGGLFYADEYEIDDEENAIPAGKAMLTAADIERHMKELDGRNHKVEWSDVRYFLDFSQNDPDVFVLKTIEEHDDFCTGRLSQVPGVDADWQDALDKYFEEQYDIKPNEWEVG